MNTTMHELSEHELGRIAGGAWPLIWPIISGLGGMAAGAIIGGWDEFKDGFEEAFWHQQNLAQ